MFERKRRGQKSSPFCLQVFLTLRLVEIHKIRGENPVQQSGIFGEKGAGIVRAECYNRNVDSAAQ